MAMTENGILIDLFFVFRWSSLHWLMGKGVINCIVFQYSEFCIFSFSLYVQIIILSTLTPSQVIAANLNGWRLNFIQLLFLMFYNFFAKHVWFRLYRCHRWNGLACLLYSLAFQHTVEPIVLIDWERNEPV